MIPLQSFVESKGSPGERAEEKRRQLTGGPRWMERLLRGNILKKTPVDQSADQAKG